MISKPGPVRKVGDEELQSIEDVILSYLSICQINGGPEKKASDMHAMLENAFKYIKWPCAL